MAKLGDTNSQVGLPFIQTGTASFSTDSNGEGVVTYPVAFAAVPIVTATATVPGAGVQVVTLTIRTDLSTATAFKVRAGSGSSAFVAATPVQFYWVAIGDRVGG